MDTKFYKDLANDLVQFTYDFDPYEFNDEWESKDDAYNDILNQLHNKTASSGIMDFLNSIKEDSVGDEDYTEELDSLIERLKLILNDKKEEKVVEFPTEQEKDEYIKDNDLSKDDYKDMGSYMIDDKTLDKKEEDSMTQVNNVAGADFVVGNYKETKPKKLESDIPFDTWVDPRSKEDGWTVKILDIEPKGWMNGSDAAEVELFDKDNNSQGKEIIPTYDHKVEVGKIYPVKIDPIMASPRLIDESKEKIPSIEEFVKKELDSYKDKEMDLDKLPNIIFKDYTNKYEQPYNDRVMITKINTYIKKYLKELYESKKLQEDDVSQNINLEDQKAQDENPDDNEKSVYDLLNDMTKYNELTVGQLNSTLQNISGQFDKIYLLVSDVYNQDPEEEQELKFNVDESGVESTFDIVYDIVDATKPAIKIIKVVKE